MSSLNPNSVSEIIRASLILVGAISQEETPGDAEAQDALNRLINMLDSWSTDEVDIYTTQRSVWPLGTSQTITAGPTGVWEMPYAPPKIDTAYVQITGTDPMSELPLRVLTTDEWAKIPVKGTVSPIPRSIWCDYQWPNSTISIWPVPQGTNNIILYLWQQLTNFASLTDITNFPPGYALAIIFNLATVLAPFYGRALTDDVKANAGMYKNRIERKNLPTFFLECDAAVQSRAQVFNWLTGDPT